MKKLDSRAWSVFWLSVLVTFVLVSIAAIQDPGMPWWLGSLVGAGTGYCVFLFVTTKERR